MTSKRPWRMEIREDTYSNIFDADGEAVGSTNDDNAALIVKAVNHHEELVTALENLILICSLSTDGGMDDWGKVLVAEALLAEIRGEK